MRKIVTMALISAQILLLSGCAAAWQNASYSDDLYSIHNKIAIAERQKAEAELAKAQYEAQQAQYEATLAKIKAEAAKQGVTVSTESNINGFDAVLADSYESAYARRLYAFSSPTYRMPSSYYSLRYSDAFFYASAYDPAFYNIMISGDMVWVEPKYVTSMFGSWGAVALPSYSWYYGWNDPFYYWNRSYRYGWYYGWNNPYYWGWGCGYPYHYHHYHHHHHRPHRPSYHRPPHHNPPHSGSGSVGNTGHNHHNRPGQVVGRNPGASRPVDRVGTTRPSVPSAGRSTQTLIRNSATATSGSKGSTSYRSSGSSSSGSSSYRSSGSSSSSSSSSSSRSSSLYRGSSSSSSRSYSAPSSSSSSSRSSYSSGGNSRGR